MKAEPLTIDPDGCGYKRCDPDKATHVRLNVPGPIPTRIIPVQLRGTRQGTGNWSWNGDIDKPTLRPSIKTTMEFGGSKPDMICHSWVNDGQVQFLGDCTHSLAGQTVDLLEID